MINGYSIRKSAKIVEINIATSFFWRHKILDCISTFLGKGYVDGVVEADEVFFAESFKGTKPSNMPRHSRKRGKQVKKRGISKEQVCITTAIDRQGNLIMELACKGRITSNELETLYDGHMANGSILCTDSHKSYIQHINALHSNLKKWINRFNGVATKYISNYIKWFKWLQIFDTDKEIIKAKNFMVQSNVTHSYIKIKDLKNRESMYV